MPSEERAAAAAAAAALDDDAPAVTSDDHNDADTMQDAKTKETAEANANSVEAPEEEDDGVRAYDRSFLLQMQFSRLAVLRPNDLPELPDIILDEVWRPTQQVTHIVYFQTIYNHSFLVADPQLAVSKRPTQLRSRAGDVPQLGTEGPAHQATVTGSRAWRTGRSWR